MMHSLRFVLLAWMVGAPFSYAQAPVDIKSLDPPAIIEQATTATPNVDETIHKAVTFLMTQQSANGSWQSRHYGSMKQGAAITSLVLYALSHLPEKILLPHAAAIKKAAQFLQPGINKQGCVANPDGSLDYPVYSTSMILTAHKKIGLGLTPLQINRMIEFLLASQCGTARGFREDNPNFGGWDILGPGHTQGKSAGANVSVTFYVLEALSQYQDSRIEPAMVRARKWCEGFTKTSTDGGFYFTSQRNSTLNKAGWHLQPTRPPRSYGSATCDGLGILLLTGSTMNDSVVSKTVAWLKAHPTISEVPGFTAAGKATGWPAGLKFYYLGALSRCLPRLGKDTAKRTGNRIARLLADQQNESGSWQSAFTHMREDDPLIATSLAAIALANVSAGE